LFETICKNGNIELFEYIITLCNKYNTDVKPYLFDYRMIEIAYGNECSDILKFIFDYNIKHNNIIDLQDNLETLFNLFYVNTNLETFKIILWYCEKYNIIFSSEIVENLIQSFCYSNNIEAIKILLDYSNNNNINIDSYEIFIDSFSSYNIHIIDYIVDYFTKKNIILNIDSEQCSYIFNRMCKIDNIELVKYIVNYCIKYNIWLDIHSEHECAFIQSIKLDSPDILIYLLYLSKHNYTNFKFNTEIHFSCFVYYFAVRTTHYYKTIILNYKKIKYNYLDIDIDTYNKCRHNCIVIYNNNIICHICKTYNVSRLSYVYCNDYYMMIY